MWELFANSLLLAAATCAIAVPVGVVLAVLLARTDLPWRRGMAAIAIAPVLVPLVVQAAAWQSGFGLLGWYTLAEGGPPWLTGWRGAIAVHAVAGVSWVVLIVAAALRLSEPELEEQALLDASPGTTLLRVTLRRSAGAAAIAALWVAVWTMAEMTVTDFFQVRTFAEVVYTELHVEPGAVPLKAGLGTAFVGVIVVAGLVLSASLVVPNWSPPERVPRVFRLRTWRWPLAIVTALALIVLVGLPLANLAVKAGVMAERQGEQFVRSWSALKCLRIVAESPFRYRRELFDSLRIAGVAATVATAVATLLGWWACRRRAGGFALCALVALTATLPGPVVGLLVIELLNRPEFPGLTWLYDRTIAAPCLAQTLRTLPWALILSWQALRSVPRGTIDSAATEGARSFELLRVAVGQRRGVFLAIWLVGLAMAFGELPATILVEPPGVTTLTVRVFGLLHAGNEDEVAGICLGMVILSAGLTLATGPLLLRAMRGRQ